MPAGANHPAIERFRRTKRHDTGDGAVALEGWWAIHHALHAGCALELVLVCPAMATARGDGADTARLLDQLRARGVPVHEVGERLLRRLVERDGPDGLAAVARLRPRRLDDLAVDRTTRLVVADGLASPGNLGTLVRCADGAGAAAVVVTEPQVRRTHPHVVKASLGTVFSLPVVPASRAATRSWLRDHGVTIVAADPAAPVSYRDAPYDGPVAIVVGSERDGLAPFWRAAADVVVSIPMLGVADSLNVAHAGALLLYEALHRAAGPAASARSAGSSRRPSRTAGRGRRPAAGS
jgi:RNA methyltransferase, TrmH family